MAEGVTMLDQYVKHAERFGVECVFETAEDLMPLDRGFLSLRLQNIDPKWKVPDRERFALDLLEAGVRPKDVCRMAQIGTKALNLLREVPREVREDAITAAQARARAIENGRFEDLDLGPVSIKSERLRALEGIYGRLEQDDRRKVQYIMTHIAGRSIDDARWMKEEVLRMIKRYESVRVDREIAQV